MHVLVESVAWVVALAWVAKAVTVARGFRALPNLLDERWDCFPEGMPSVTVVPARNEAADIGATLRSLLAQDYPKIKIIAVDDRSTDQTGTIMEQMVREHSERLRMTSVTKLPEGWLGKTHAMALAARGSAGDWLLFTDGDVAFAPDALRRSLVLAEDTGAEHLVTMPTMQARRWDEGMLLGFFQTVGLWVVRPWRIADPRARHDAIGVGAFNLIRRSAYEQIGGFDAFPMVVLEDVTLGRRVKAAGLVQRVAFGRGLVRIHWANGALGMVQATTKNMFSGVGYRVSLVLGGCLWITVFCLLPGLGILVGVVRVPAVVTMLAVAAIYRVCSERSGISAWYMLLFPLSALIFIVALLRSMVVVPRRGGVEWRGTLYPLKELRGFVEPLH